MKKITSPEAQLRIKLRALGLRLTVSKSAEQPTEYWIKFRINGKYLKCIYSRDLAKLTAMADKITDAVKADIVSSFMEVYALQKSGSTSTSVGNKDPLNISQILTEHTSSGASGVLLAPTS